MKLPPSRLIATSVGPIAYRRAGSGPPLLLIHGWGGSSRYWLGAYSLLAERHDLIAFDLPGFGDSPPPAGPTRLDTLAAAALALSAELGIARAAVAGHSLGSAVALLLAAFHPQLVERVVMASFGLPRTPVEAVMMGMLHTQLSLSLAAWSPWLAAWSPWLLASRGARVLAWTTPPLPTLLAASVVRRLETLPYAVAALGAADLAVMDARAAVEAASTSGDPAVVAAAQLVTAPALVISGRDDPLFPPDAASALAAALPNSGLTLLDACGLGPRAERPGAFYGTIGAFIAA